MSVKGLVKPVSLSQQSPIRKGTTVDGRNPANQLRLVVYPIIYRVFYIPGGAGFLPSTVSLEDIHPS